MTNADRETHEQCTYRIHFLLELGNIQDLLTVELNKQRQAVDVIAVHQRMRQERDNDNHLLAYDMRKGR